MAAKGGDIIILGGHGGGGSGGEHSTHSVQHQPIPIPVFMGCYGHGMVHGHGMGGAFGGYGGY